MRKTPSKRVFAFRLDAHSGVPVYRQLMDQVHAASATGSLSAGDQLPTVRQVAVDLAINPNTVSRAYREMEIRGVLETQQGSGTFLAHQRIEHSEAERNRQLTLLAGEFVSRAGLAGFSVEQLMESVQTFVNKTALKRR